MSEETAIQHRASGGAIVKHDYGEYDGQGYENQTQADKAIPFLALAQALSPQINKKNAAYIEGLEAGMLFNSVTGEVYGEDVNFIPSITENCYTLWVPRDNGGGYRGRLEINDPVVAEAKARATREGKRPNEIQTEDGLDIVETFYVWGAVVLGEGDDLRVEPIVVAFTSTKIGVYKKWMTRLGTFQVTTPQGRRITPPLFAHLTRLGSVEDQNSKGQDFFNFTAGPAVNDDIADSLIGPGDPRFDLGAQLRELVTGGAVKAAVESQNGEQAGGNGPAAGGDDDIPF